MEATLGEDLAGEEDLCGRVEESVGPRGGERMATPTQATTRMDSLNHFASLELEISAPITLFIHHLMSYSST